MAPANKSQVAAAAPRVTKCQNAMTVVLRNVPPGYNWGWYSREDQRMHLQTVDREHRNQYKVWLEKKGSRVFEPAGQIPARVLKSLKAEVASKRRHIEGRWGSFMIRNVWLQLHVALPLVSITAYPNTPNKFTRIIDLTTWLEPKQLATLSPEIIELNRDMAALRLWTNRPEEQCYDVRLSKLLWGGDV